MLSVVTGAVLALLGLLLLSQSWRSSQDRIAPGGRGVVAVLLGGSGQSSEADSGNSGNPGNPGGAVGAGRSAAGNWYVAHRNAAVPLGLTGGVVALAGLAVLTSGWDVIGASAAVIGLAALLVGLGWTALVARRALRSG